MGAPSPDFWPRGWTGTEGGKGGKWITLKAVAAGSACAVTLNPSFLAVWFVLARGAWMVFYALFGDLLRASLVRPARFTRFCREGKFYLPL